MLYKTAIYFLGTILLISCDRKTTQENIKEKREGNVASVATRWPEEKVNNWYKEKGWLQSPGVEILKDITKHNQLQGYVKGVLRRFVNDKRFDAWDLFNEPDNINRPAYVQHEPENKEDFILSLLKKTFRWAREINPSQPLTVAVWVGNWSDTSAIKPLDSLMLASSDVISFHNYDSTQVLEQKIKQLQRLNRPILCTEYMARGNNSTFKGSLPTLQKYNVAAYNWGFVAGKTQTIYPWDSWTKTYTAEPKLWFHDIFRKDGTPYRQDEVTLIKQLTTGAKKP